MTPLIHYCEISNYSKGIFYRNFHILQGRTPNVANRGGIRGFSPRYSISPHTPPPTTLLKPTLCASYYQTHRIYCYSRYCYLPVAISVRDVVRCYYSHPPLSYRPSYTTSLTPSLSYTIPLSYHPSLTSPLTQSPSFHPLHTTSLTLPLSRPTSLPPLSVPIVTMAGPSLLLPLAVHSLIGSLLQTKTSHIGGLCDAQFCGATYYCIERCSASLYSTV
jgi:hypothetical protein